MTALAWSLAGLATLLALAFAALWWRSTRESRKLLGAADQKQEQLQRQFQRFLPEDVVERLND